MNVLVVDDNPINRKLLRVTLEAEGMATMEAADGLEALAVLERQPVDAIISDILMPRMDGFRFCYELRQNQRFAGLPFIIYSATYTSPGDEKLALDSGADRYLRKPCPIGALIAALHELTAEAQDRRREEAQLPQEAVMKEYNEALIRKLEDKKDELLAANHELEAFSYSVSHDLRTPLLTILSFTQILQEEHADQLDDEGRRLLERVVSNAEQMAQLIEALLRFSRASRQELKKTWIDMPQLVQSVVDELREHEPDRSIAVRIGRLENAQGDPAVLRQVWTNLLSNAFKFTRSRPDAEVRIDSRIADGEVVYSVCDNGVGFDMAYVGRLFGVFNRLHNDEHPGTGIGLAIVERVVARHGGRVCAEGQLGNGACFTFTLPHRSRS